MLPVLAPADGADADRTRNTGHAMPDRLRQPERGRKINIQLYKMNVLYNWMEEKTPFCENCRKSAVGMGFYRFWDLTVA